MPDWTENGVFVIPIASRNTMSAIAERIMPDVNEGVMFDGTRLSTTGREPATHLATACPLTKEQADQWRQILLPDSLRLNDYPIAVTRLTDRLAGLTVMLDPKSVAIVTDRISENEVKRTKTVRLVNSVLGTLKEVSAIDDIFAELRLVKITPTGDK